MLSHAPTLSTDELRKRLAPFCEKHRMRRLEVFGSAAIANALATRTVHLGWIGMSAVVALAVAGY